MDLRPVFSILAKRSEEEGLPGWLFTFTHAGYAYRGIMIPSACTTLLAVQGQQVAWLVSMRNDGSLDKWVPEVVYKVIGRSLVDEQGKRSNARLFDQMAKAMNEQCQGSVGMNRNAIQSQLLACATKTKRYGKDGDKPYFWHWRRIPPSPEGLAKIQDVFGWNIRHFCMQNGITGVWRPEASPDSMLFLDATSTTESLKRLLNRPKG